MKKLLAAVAVLALSLPTLASASSPASTWADVEEITFEPNAKDPTTATRALIKGVFAKSNMDSAMAPTFAAPKRGVLYYECPADKLDLCRLEWKDIASTIGTTNCAGWGDGLEPAGAIKEWCAAKGASEVYPIHMGVQRTPWASGTCDGLKMFAAAPTCGGVDAGDDTGTTSDTGTLADTGTAVADSGTTTTDTGTSVSDTGTKPADPAPAGRDDTGCTMGRGSSSASAFALAMIALGFVVRRRRI